MIIRQQDTRLTDDQAAALFGAACSVGNEFSLAALLRAIVLEKEPDLPVNEWKEKTGIHRYTAYSTADVSYSLNNYAYAVDIAVVSPGMFNEINCTGESWSSLNSQPYYLDKYLSQIRPTKIHINTYTKRVSAIVSGTPDSKWTQAFCSCLWIMLPWYYPEKTDEVFSFFKKISVNNTEVNEADAAQFVIDYVNSIADKIDMHTKILESVVAGLADSARIKLLESTKQAIDDLRRDISSLVNSLGIRYTDLDNKIIYLKGLEMQEAASDEEFLKFFIDHKNVTVTSKAGSDLYYYVIDTLEYYDEDEVETLLTSTRSWASNWSSDIRKIISAVFCEHKGIFRVGAKFMLSDIRLVEPMSSHCPEENSCMPNPHIYFYGCSGGNDAYYSKYAEEGAWDLAIEQSISATKNWNVGDSTVGERMFSWIFNHMNTKCIYVKDGSPMSGVTPECKLVSPREFLDLINENEKGEEKNV